ncbi:Kinase, NEK [Spironucleus salmonicida]|uniref:non-specific serine/threonine protein kinase n=1 Tax=Spironucleus salmonicida TaxID=348837 RepID=V6LCS5_9EUKA|nr:Kinase, NEK [Spironucleus salmonicida]|eukprot:EST42252.1 Kinase, NEK [Spironucleus salmonicida]
MNNTQQVIKFKDEAAIQKFLQKIEVYQKNQSAQLLQIINFQIVGLELQIFLEDSSSYISLEQLIQLFKIENIYFKEGQILYIFQQILSAICSMHKQQLIHRALYPENIFFDQNFNVKIGIFSQLFCGRQQSVYDSPEFLTNKQYNQKSDIFAIGCILYYISSFQQPFPISQKTIVTGILFSSVQPIPTFYSANLYKIIKAMLNRDYKPRPEPLKLINNTIFSGFDLKKEKQDLLQVYYRLKNNKIIEIIQLNINNNDLKKLLDILLGNDLELELRISIVETELKIKLEDKYQLIYNTIINKISNSEALLCQFIDDDIQDILIQIIQNIISFKK